MAVSLPDPIELCLEELDDAIDTPYVRCTAVAGGCPGLCFSQGGEVLWKLNDHALAELWVSLDRRLIFYRKRPEGQVSLTRAERHLQLPLAKPVIVLDGDEISVEGKRFRVHVHGTAAVVSAPERLKLRRARNLAVGAALVGALAGCQPASRAGPGPIAPSPSARTAAPTGTNRGDAGTAPGRDTAAVSSDKSDAGKPDGSRANVKTPPIDVRDRPPLIEPMDD